ncbi:hypothetical protein D3C84_780730 [compost metagenome]
MLLEDPGHVLQLGPGQACSAGHRVLRAGDHAELFLAQAVEQQVVGPCAGGDAAQHYVQLVLLQRLDQHVAGVDLDAHGQARVALLQGGDGAGQQARRKCRNGAHRDPAEVARLQRGQLFAHAGKLGEDHSRVVDHRFAEGRGAHAAGQAFEQLDAEQAFGLVEHLGRRGLGHADLVGGAAQ